MALDPATRENGCLQIIPSSHKIEIVDHVLYEDSIHGELPRERVQEMIDTYGVNHIELEPGSVVCWHSNAWHYSPPNTSENGRIAISGVYSTPEIVQNGVRHEWDYRWVAKNNTLLSDFPPQPYHVKNANKGWKPKPYSKIS
jgi:ectoine hydroxylase-related dioxygenase (phytanoyl-CoA dioxygenase family)